MRCGKVQRMISARADGELDEALAETVEQHIAGCEVCRAFAGDLALLAGKLDQVGAAEPRWGFSDRVLARLPAEEPVQRTAGGLWGLLRPAPLGLGMVAFSLGVVATMFANGANGERSDNRPAPDAVIEAVAGDYATVLAEATIHEQLWNLLPESED